MSSLVDDNEHADVVSWQDSFIANKECERLIYI